MRFTSPIDPRPLTECEDAGNSRNAGNKGDGAHFQWMLNVSLNFSGNWSIRTSRLTNLRIFVLSLAVVGDSSESC